jgi:hypothetical protein
MGPLFFGYGSARDTVRDPGGLPGFAIWGYVLFWFTTNPPRLRQVPPALLVAGWILWACLSFVFGRFVYRGLYDVSHAPIAATDRVVYLEVRHGGTSQVLPCRYR